MASHRHSRSLQAQVDESSSMIYDAAKDEDWQRVLELCETHPHCAKYAGPDGSTALHLACQHKCQDTAVFEALLHASPDSILKQEDKGMVPLHYACRFQAPSNIVTIMVELFPGSGIASVSKRDRKGRTPLYYAEREDASLDVVSMLRDMNPKGSVEQMEDEELEESPPRPESLTRMTSFHRSFLEGSTTDIDTVLGRSMGPELAAPSMNNIDPYTNTDSGADSSEFDDREVLEQFRIMAVHEAHLRLRNATGFDIEEHQQPQNPEGLQGVLLKIRLPEPKRIMTANNMPELQEPSLPSIRPAPVFYGRREQIEPEVTPGERVLPDHDVPMRQQVIECLGCREKLCCKQKAMMVRCPNCGIESLAISGSINESETGLF